MSEIIKKPHYEIRCPVCACHFKFELEDITNKRYGLYEECKTDDSVICPNCKIGIPVRDGKKNLLSTVKVRY